MAFTVIGTLLLMLSYIYSSSGELKLFIDLIFGSILQFESKFNL